jgi:hypothetical protein
LPSSAWGAPFHLQGRPLKADGRLNGCAEAKDRNKRHGGQSAGRRTNA